MATLLRKIVHINLETGTRKEYESIRHAEAGSKVTKHFICQILKSWIADKNGNLFISEEFEKDVDAITIKHREYQKKYKDAMRLAKENGTYEPKTKNKTLPCAFDIEMKQMEKEVSIYKKQIATLKEESDQAQVRNRLKDDLDNYYKI